MAPTTPAPAPSFEEDEHNDSFADLPVRDVNDADPCDQATGPNAYASPRDYGSPGDRHPQATEGAPVSPTPPRRPAMFASPQPMPPAAARRDNKASRAFQQLGEACRRLSEVGLVSGLSAVTSAAAAWVLPTGSHRRASSGWPSDVEAALSPCDSSASSQSTPLHKIAALDSPCTGSTSASRGSSNSISVPLRRSPLSAVRVYESPTCASSAVRGKRPEDATTDSSRSGTLAACALSPLFDKQQQQQQQLLAHLPPPPVVAPLLLDAMAPLRFSPHKAQDQEQRGEGQGERRGGGGDCRHFKPRVTPADGLLHLAPSMRAMMWSPRRGSRWTLDEYELTRKLYRGYASTVYRAMCLTSHTEVVLKVYSLAALTDFLRHQVLRELDIHSRLKHPGIVQLLAAFREGDLLVLVLEYVRGGSLEQARRKLGGRMSEAWAAHLVVLPLLRVLSFMHRLGVVHRDVKPENILFTQDWRLKLCDFGVSIYLHEERAVTRAGSNEYMAPEVSACPLKSTPADNKVNDELAYGAAADVWSLGALVYELLVGFTPFPGGPPTCAAATARRAAAAGGGSIASSGGCGGGGGVSLAFPARVSPAARAFILACLEPHPGDRPTVEQLMQQAWVLGAQQGPPLQVNGPLGGAEGAAEPKTATTTTTSTA